MRKYSLLRERVMASNLVPPQHISEPMGATDEQLLRVHSHDYLENVKNGTLNKSDIRRMGFPWSLGLVERSRRSVGGTIAACQNALIDGMAVNLAGGTHHAGRDHGEGFCVFNDVVVAARAMQSEAGVERVLIVDCDVHQGNGTASLCANDPTIFTFSIHGEKNFPFRKMPSDLDIALADGTTDADYLEALELGLLQSLSLAHADLVIYLSGADAYVGDRLGRLSLSKQGLLARDQMVYGLCQSMGLPIATVMAGGYAPQIEDIVDIHFQTVQLAVALTPS
jgi:acetoin utilization deacetylase AcuC-like enzyme